MGIRLLASILVAVGVVLVVLSAFADTFGIGDGDAFGSKQVAGVVVGGLAVAAGLVLMYVRRGREVSARATE